MDRHELRDLIKCETAYRNPYERQVQIWTGRLEHYRLAEAAPDGSVCLCVIANADGINGNNQTLASLCEARGFTSAEHIEQFLKQLKETIKVSVYKEKFMRHAHNKNHPEAERYHLRLCDKAACHMEQFESNPDLACAGIDHTVNGGAFTLLQRNDQGYIDFCAEMQKAHDWRVRLLEAIK